MIGGALNFTLGLQANQFLNNIGIASGKLIGFLGVANGVRIAFDKMWNAVQQGGKLTDLAAAASISVKELYQLQFAFEQIGASADSVNSVILRMRANLAQGNQDDVLAQLGLDPDALRRSGVVAQFETIAAAIAKLDATSRAGVAQTLFGREGANVAQIIANSGNDFANAMERAADDAQIWQNVAPAFDAIADKVTELQRHIETVWAQLAGALVQAFNEGKLAEVITDVISTGFKAGLAVVPGLFVKLGEVLLNVLQVPLAYLKTGLDDIINNFIVGASVDPKVARYLREQGFDPDESRLNLGGSTFQERLDENIRLNALAMEEISAAANNLLRDNFGDAAKLLGGLSDRLTDFTSRLPQGSGAGITPSLAAPNFRAQKSLTTDFTDLEKMGFVFGGLGRGFGGDDARRTADNTKRTVTLLEQTNQLLEQQATASYANI